MPTSSSSPDPQLLQTVEKLSHILRESGYGGAVILVSPKVGGLLVVEPHGWWRRDGAELTGEEKSMLGHFMSCMHDISSSLAQVYHRALEHVGYLSGDTRPDPKNPTLWN